MCHNSQGGFVWFGFFPLIFITVSVVLKDSQIRLIEVHLTLERSNIVLQELLILLAC